MQTVPYSELLKSVWDQLGYPTDANGDPMPSTPEWHSAKRAIAKALQRVWNFYFWPDLTRIELRRYAKDWALADAVSAGEVRFYAPTGAYYQALRTATGNAPAILSGGQWTTNLDYWAFAQRSLAVDLYDAAITYAKGDRVYYATTAKFYQAHTAPPAATAPTDTNYWGEITVLDPVVPWTRSGLTPIGRVDRCYHANPATYRGAQEVPFNETTNGLQIREPDLNEVWVKYLKRPFRFTGNIDDGATTYEPVSEEDDVPVVSGSSANQMLYLEFATVADMLATDSDLFDLAKTHNYATGDQQWGVWLKSTDPNLTDNGSNVRETGDGAVMLRISP